MKAIEFSQYGPPSTLKVVDRSKPSPKPNEVLIKVMATSINSLDKRISQADPFLVKLDKGFPNPKSPLLGADLAGVVEEVGSEVTKFEPGDEVFGEISSTGLGAYAEYAVAPENVIALKPSNISFTQAAAIPAAAITALQGFKKVGLTSGQHVLINGASGGVGHFAVQIAKASGARVTAICSTDKVETIKQLGAEAVIDYKQTAIREVNGSFDLIFEGVGNLSAATMQRLLKPEGKAIVVGFTTILHMIILNLFGGSKIKFITANTNAQDLSELATMVSEGKIKPVIDQEYSGIEQIPTAISHFQSKHPKGKIVINLS